MNVLHSEYNKSLNHNKTGIPLGWQRSWVCLACIWNNESHINVKKTYCNKNNKFSVSCVYLYSILWSKSRYTLRVLKPSCLHTTSAFLSENLWSQSGTHWKVVLLKISTKPWSIPSGQIVPFLLAWHKRTSKSSSSKSKTVWGMEQILLFYNTA